MDPAQSVALVKEVFYQEGKGIDEVKAELAFFKSQDETIHWERQQTPGMDWLGEETDTNFYLDPNDAMRHWMENVERIA